ncbi:hypothetical protein DMH25_03215 [Streptomyces sp. WAC 01325]|nr:hypothetical protein DMH25_03215 [Streptomyces sp. WAC 01325]
MGPTLRSKPVIWATYAYDDVWDGAEHVRERGLVVALRASKGGSVGDPEKRECGRLSWGDR